MRVLVAEDDEYLLSALILALQHKGYAVEPVKTGLEARAALLANTYDLVLLDLGLGHADGLDVLKDLRKREQEVPVIIITARDRIEDKIHGLDLGASDYLVKPFDFRELEARMRAAIRKTQWRNKVEIRFGGLVLDTNSGQLSLEDQDVELTPKEVAVLKMLMARPGSVVSKRHLIDQLSDWSDATSENAIEIIVHRLRKKLESADIVIQTARGFGYSLEQRQ